MVRVFMCSYVLVFVGGWCRIDAEMFGGTVIHGVSDDLTRVYQSILHKGGAAVKGVPLQHIVLWKGAVRASAYSPR